MEAVWLILLAVGIVVMVYASSRLRAERRAGWVDVFTPVHGGEELAIDFRSALTARGIESRTHYPGVAGAPSVGMSGASEVWVAVRRESAEMARELLYELLEARRERDAKRGDDE